MWKHLDGTQSVLKELDAEIQMIERSFFDFGGFIKSDALEREYCLNVGILQGLNKAKQFIEEYKENDDEDVT